VGFEGQIAIRAWLGGPADPATQVSGVGWKRGVQWITYMPKNFVTPPFPGYTSGHSTFSRSAAEVLAAVTGTPFFPGGLGTFTATQDEYLTIENGPSHSIELQWATYFVASAESIPTMTTILQESPDPGLAGTPGQRPRSSTVPGR
jgi:hypothetical protein